MIDVYCTGCLRPTSEHAVTFGRCDDGARHRTHLMDSEHVRELRITRAREDAARRDQAVAEEAAELKEAGDH